MHCAKLYVGAVEWWVVELWMCNLGEIARFWLNRLIPGLGSISKGSENAIFAIEMCHGSMYEKTAATEFQLRPLWRDDICR